MKLSAPRVGTGLSRGRTITTRNTPLQDRPFIAWDGEGVNLKGPGKPQSYVLFGCNHGHVSNHGGLSAFDCLDFIIETGLKHPGAFHVGFAFTYDANMIIRSLSPVTLGRLHRNGWVRLRRSDGRVYAVTFARGKFFRVTLYRPEYDSKRNPHAKTTVQIFDIFSFFAKSFIKAYESMVGPVPDIIKEGKAARAEFTIDEFDDILNYWSEEIQMLKRLAEELRRRVYNAGLRITQWHGPGALATYALRSHRIKQYMSQSPDGVRLASRYGYAGGRFELYKIGRIRGPVFAYDINSAYPHAIRQLPDLATGTWSYVESPSRISRFGIYRVRLKMGHGFMGQPSPVFHRDRNHNITFPWVTDGWYWSPEAWHAMKCGAEIVEGWEYTGWSELPFAWVADMYAQRKDWQMRGIAAQIALKLCMNSMYGKLAQRVGWDPISQRLPPFHQLEWAGWITSLTRARLFDVMSRIPFDRLIAVETDGLYSTVPPSEIGISMSTELGGWDIKEYDEVMYVQSGLAWLHDNGGWHDKRRGLDACRNNHRPDECTCTNVFSLSTCREYLSSLHASPDRSAPWQAYKGQSTRFIGLGQALQSAQPFHTRHCVWETAPREITPGGGKRTHFPPHCATCQSGNASAYDMAHDLVIHSAALFEPQSYPHSVPWEEEIGHAVWRDYEDQDSTTVI